MSFYQPAIHSTARDEYDQPANIFKEGKINTVDKRKFTETTVDANAIETVTSEVEYDNEVHLKPIMQTFDYEEPIKHEPVQMSYSENSGEQYFNCIVISVLNVIYGDL